MSNSASTWKLNDFNNLGISYKKTPDDLEFFLQIIENKMEDSPNFDKEKVLLLGHTLVNFTARYWTSSTYLNTYEEIEKTLKLVDKADDLDNDLSKLRSEYDKIIGPFLPTVTKLREKTLEGFARYIEFHFPSINFLVVKKCN